MKNSSIYLAFIIVFGLDGISQTRLISHKSHSGSNKKFEMVMKENLFNNKASNFGMAPQRFVRNSNLDSVILVSENVAVMVTSESCHWEDYGRGKPSKGELWSAGRDTVYSHPVFTAKNSIKTIKQTLKEEYYFANSIDSVVFIGFDGNYAVNKPLPKNENPKADKRVIDTEKDLIEYRKRKPNLFMLVVLSIFSALFKSSF